MNRLTLAAGALVVVGILMVGVSVGTVSGMAVIMGECDPSVASQAVGDMPACVDQVKTLEGWTYMSLGSGVLGILGGGFLLFKLNNE